MTNKKPLTILLTGGIGFIGGHVGEFLLDRGDNVVCIDSCSSYYDKQQKFYTLEILKKKKTNGFFIMKEVNLNDEKEITKVFEEYAFDKIVHLAAQAGVRHSIENSIENVEINVLATVRLLEMARKYKIQDIVLASSSSVYGVDSSPPFKESHFCAKPISPYAASKRSCELFAYTYHHLYEMNITCLRFFTVYGPRGRPDMAVFKFIDAIMKNKPVNVFGNGKAEREFTYISDIVDGVINAIDKPQSFQIMNLGGGETYTVNQLIETIEKHLGKKAEIKYIEKQLGDVPLTRADQTNAREFLNFSPKVDLNTGVLKTIEWFRDYIMWQEK